MLGSAFSLCNVKAMLSIITLQYIWRQDSIFWELQYWNWLCALFKGKEWSRVYLSEALKPGSMFPFSCATAG